jgi:hypothetical protein
MNPLERQSLPLNERRLFSKDKRTGSYRLEVLQRARRLVAQSGTGFPPADLDNMVKSLGLPPVRYVPLAVDGRLVRDGPNYSIEVNERHPPARKRFTIAHEIGHIILGSGGLLGCSRIHMGGAVGQEPDPREEGLADLAAAEILMPAHWAFEFLGTRLPTFSTIAAMAKACETSIEVAARRLVECGDWRCRLIWWRQGGSRLRAVRSFPNYDPVVLSGMELLGEGDSIVAKVMRSGKPISGTQAVKVEGEMQEYNMEAWKAGPTTVATLLVLEQVPRPSPPTPTLFPV